MPWKLVNIRKSGRKPLNDRKCKICEREIVDEKAWKNAQEAKKIINYSVNLYKKKRSLK